MTAPLFSESPISQHVESSLAISGHLRHLAREDSGNHGGEMRKRDLMLAALAAADRAEHTPVQVQKLLFLIEKNVSKELGGPTFDFVAYDYGPFDSSVYDVLRALEQAGLATASVTSRGWKKYALTPAGQEEGLKQLEQLPDRASKYIKEVSQFVRRLGFADLVSAIYKAYPEMKVNSVFKG
jgi:uncharacterized protein